MDENAGKSTTLAIPTALTPEVAASLLEHTPVGLAVIDGERQEILYGNAYIGRLLEESHPGGASTRLADLLPSEFAVTIAALLDDVLRYKQVKTEKGLAYSDSTGNPRAWDVTVAPLRSSTTEPSRVILHILDVTDAVYGSAGIRQVAEFDRIKEDFLAVTAHELRTPVTALLGYTNLMVSRAEHGDWTDRDLHALRMIQAQAKRLTQLINGLVDVARIQTGEVELRYQQVDLSELVQRMIKEARLSAGDYTIEVELPAEPVEIWGDAHRIEQVLNQLLDNALKYSPWGGTIRVRLWTDDQAHLAMVDQGIGIPEDELPQLFDRFYRASNIDSDRISGLGIGLYLAREFIAAHHGRIAVRSVPNQETVFEITLPLYAEGRSISNS